MKRKRVRERPRAAAIFVETRAAADEEKRNTKCRSVIQFETRAVAAIFVETRRLKSDTVIFGKNQVREEKRKTDFSEE